MDTETKQAGAGASAEGAQRHKLRLACFSLVVINCVLGLVVFAPRGERYQAYTSLAVYPFTNAVTNLVKQASFREAVLHQLPNVKLQREGNTHRFRISGTAPTPERALREVDLACKRFRVCVQEFGADGYYRGPFAPLRPYSFYRDELRPRMAAWWKRFTGTNTRGRQR